MIYGLRFIERDGKRILQQNINDLSDGWEDVPLVAVAQCRCGKNPMTPDEHTCPYQEDVNNDSVSMCSCCADCQHECAMDI